MSASAAPRGNDCNGNGVDDSQDIASGTSVDCNGNGVPDECEDGTTTHTTGNMGSVSAATPASGQWIGCVPSTTPVSIRVVVRADLGAPTEFVTLRINNTNIANLFAQTGRDCDQISDATVTIPAAQWNALIASGGSTMQVRLNASSFVEACSKPPGSSVVSVRYGNSNYDCNGNLLSDLCEIAGGAADCNDNGRLDSCEIAGGQVPDCDQNGVPDSCQADSDGDGAIDACDGCPADPAKTAPGICGCGVADTDSDGDGVANCNDGCPNDPAKTAPGVCGCGVPDTDSDGDGTANCIDGCPNDPSKTAPGICGCGVPDTDSDGDGTANCNDGCPNDPNKVAPGTCGCGVPDIDSDSDGRLDCVDNCPSVANPDQLDCNANGIGDICEQFLDCNGNGIPDSCDIASKESADTNNDGIPDECALDCNGNSVVDVIDIAQGTSDDCNGNDVPDECEDGSAAHTTGDMGPFYWQHPALGQLSKCRLSTTPVRIRVEVVGDLDAPTEFVTLRLNNTNIANLFVQDGEDCDATSVATVTLSATQWNALVAAGGSTIEVRLVASSLVDPDCSVPPRNPLPGRSEVRVEYGNGNYDCNGNGIPGDNRTVGTFIPEDDTRRAEIPATPPAVERMKAYAPRAGIAMGEAFDPSPANIAARTSVRRIDELAIALLAKRTRGESVDVSLGFRFGDAASLSGRGAARQFVLEMLERGTTRLTRSQLAEEKARLKMRGSLLQFRTTRTHLAGALRLAAHAMRESVFPPAEFEQLRRSTLTRLQARLANPEVVSFDAHSTHFNTYPEGDPRHAPSIAAQIMALQRLDVEDVKAFHSDLWGGSRGQIAIVGDFEPGEVEPLVRELFSGWRSKAAYAPVVRDFRPVAPTRIFRDVPETESASLRARVALDLRDDDDDFLPLMVADTIFGGGAGMSNRVMDRVRQREGLSYSAGSVLAAGYPGRAGTWTVYGSFAPQNAARFETAVREELERLLKDGVTPQELADAVNGLLQEGVVERSQDNALSSRWVTLLDAGRDFGFVRAREERLRKLTVDEVVAAVRRHLDPARLTVVVAGDAA